MLIFAPFCFGCAWFDNFPYSIHFTMQKSLHSSLQILLRITKRFKVCAHKSESGRWKFDIVVHLRDLCDSSRCRCSAVSVVRRRLSTWRWVKAITRTLDLWLELSTKELPAVGSWWVAHQLSKELSSVLHVSIVPFTIKLQLWSETGGYWVVQCVIWLSQDLFHRVSCKCETTRNLF